MENGYRKVKLYFDRFAGRRTPMYWLRHLRDVAAAAGSWATQPQHHHQQLHAELHTPFSGTACPGGLRRQDLLRAAFKRLRGLKVDFTDVRLSAMEDFVGVVQAGPGDRSRRRAGAGMDAWFESLPHLRGLDGAIAEAGLEAAIARWSWGDGVLLLLWTATTQGLLRSALLWDHIDTGIDKRWLAEDLQRALEAAVVPDCSFDGCTSCGVCGPDLGHNIVVPAPDVPERSRRRPPVNGSVVCGFSSPRPAPWRCSVTSI